MYKVGDTWHLEWSPASCPKNAAALWGAVPRNWLLPVWVKEPTVPGLHNVEDHCLRGKPPLWRLNIGAEGGGAIAQAKWSMRTTGALGSTTN